MKKLLALITFVLFTTLSFAQTYVTTTTLNVRDTSNTQGHILASIPSGASVQSLSQSNGWVRVKYKSVTGYVNSKYLQASPSTNGDPQTKSYTNPPKSAVHYYTNVDGNTVQAPTKYASAPEGATAKCNDGTYSFSQHARGTCSHHGGVAKWLH